VGGVILNLGCGQKPRPDAVNVDRVAMPGVDVVHDLDSHPWPWHPETATEVHALHIFEHVADPIGFMEQAHRVLIPGGLLHIEVPHWQSRNAYTDPTHRRFCTEETFRYWVPGNWLWTIGGPAYHRGCAFDEVLNEVTGHGDLVVELRRR